MKRGTVSVPGDLNRFRLFLVSYCPLWAMLAFRSMSPHSWQWSNRTALALVFALLAIYTLFDARRLVAGAKRSAAIPLYLCDVNDQGGNAAGYLATYLLPFIGLVPAGWEDWIAYAIYFLVAAVVFIRTDLSLVNPTLYLIGWRVVSASAFLDDQHSADQRVGSSPVIVVCRDPGALTKGRVEVVTLAGCFVTKVEPKN